MPESEIRFDGRVAIVTGAGNGIGRGHAKALAARGAAVVVNDLGGQVAGGGGSSRAADLVVEEIRASGGVAVASYDSVASLEGGKAIVSTALDNFGKLDILINNAGIMRTCPFPQASVEDLDAILDTHLKGAFYVTQPAFVAMQKSKYGRILFTSSSGLLGLPGMAHYGAAKAGLIGLMNVLAIEGEEHGILSNLLLPGAQTRMWTEDAVPDQFSSDFMAKLGRSMEPEFVTPLALYLVSDRCQTTHSMYSALASRYARAFIGVAKGWRGPVDQPASLEDVAAHWDKINSTDDFSIFEFASDELPTIIG